MKCKFQSEIYISNATHSKLRRHIDIHYEKKNLRIRNDGENQMKLIFYQIHGITFSDNTLILILSKSIKQISVR